MSQLTERFRYQLHLAGLETNDPIFDGGLMKRFHVLGDSRRSRNGWYVLYSDFPVVAAYGCWKRHIQGRWQPERESNLSLADLRLIRERKLAIALQYNNEFQSETAARRNAEIMWQTAVPASDKHRYLVRKGIRSHGLRFKKNSLLIPVMDADGMFYGLQRIWPDGSKQFAKGTVVTAHFFIIGDHREDTMLIAEGYATAATIYECTGYPVAVCFGSANMLSTSRAIHQAWPGYRIVICADDDHVTDGNPGLAAATAAASAIGGDLILPRFREGRLDEASDFNDLYHCDGTEAVLYSLREGGLHVYNYGNKEL